MTLENVTVENGSLELKASNLRSKRYSEEFKRGAVELTLTNSNREVAKQLDVGVESISNWKQEYLSSSGTFCAPSASSSNSAKSYAELQKELHRALRVFSGIRR